MIDKKAVLEEGKTVVVAPKDYIAATAAVAQLSPEGIYREKNINCHGEYQAFAHQNIWKKVENSTVIYRTCCLFYLS